MKPFVVLATLIAVISAIPTPHHHPGHQHGDPATNAAPSSQAGTGTGAVAAAPAAAATTPAQNNGGGGQGHRGGHHGNPGNQGTSATAQAPPPAAATSPAGTGGATNGGQTGTTGAIDPSLVPDFGLQAGLSPDGTGNCKAANGKNIPCSCPPDRNAFIQKLGEFVSAGSFFGTLPAPFPTGNTNQDALTRIDTIISTLQNFDGKPGVGCPAISAPNFSVVQQQLLAGGA